MPAANPADRLNATIANPADRLHPGDRVASVDPSDPGQGTVFGVRPRGLGDVDRVSVDWDDGIIGNNGADELVFLSRS